MERPTDTRAAAVFFARISRELMEERAELTTLHRIVERAVAVVPARRASKMDILAAIGADG